METLESYSPWLNLLGLLLAIACAFMVGMIFRHDLYLGCTLSILLLSVVLGLLAASGASIIQRERRGGPLD